MVLLTSLFICTSESVDLLLFQPETTEEQFHFYLQQVNGRLEGYKEYFDWLLSAEEFHSEPDWLECMRNNAVEISDIEHVLKMIDIIYMQGQLLYSEEASSDIIYRDMKEVFKLTHTAAQMSLWFFSFLLIACILPWFALWLESPETLANSKFLFMALEFFFYFLFLKYF